MTRPNGICERRSDSVAARTVFTAAAFGFVFDKTSCVFAQIPLYVLLCSVLTSYAFGIFTSLLRKDEDECLGTLGTNHLKWPNEQVLVLVVNKLSNCCCFILLLEQFEKNNFLSISQTRATGAVELFVFGCLAELFGGCGTFSQGEAGFYVSTFRSFHSVS